MKKSAIRTVVRASLSAVMLIAAPLRADPVSITVRHINLHPATPAEARHAFLKIDEAALRVCGASGFSLEEAKAATRASPCWQEAVGSALHRSGNRLLARTFERFVAGTRMAG